MYPIYFQLGPFFHLYGVFCFMLFYYISLYLFIYLFIIKIVHKVHKKATHNYTVDK